MTDGADNPAFQAEESDGPSELSPQAEKEPKVDAGSLGDAESTGEAPERVQWSSGLEFLMSCISMSVGLGNVWRFPFTAYENGGGAFLIPYIIVLIIIGRPLYYLEMGLGQFASVNGVQVWRMSPALRGVGYGQIGSTIILLCYYSSLLAISLYYFGLSFQETLPWSYCREEWGPCVPSVRGNDTIEKDPNATEPLSSAELFFTKYVLRERDDLSEGIGWPDWRLSLTLLASWLCVLVVIIRGVRSAGKAAYFLALFPYVVMIVLLVRGVTLPGAGDGIIFFIKPQWERLGDAKVWHAAVSQAFFSLNVGFGLLINYSSFNSFTHNIYRDAMIVTTLDTFTSLLAGCTIFSILGNLAYEMKTSDIGSVVQAGAGLAFISYPDAIAKFDAVPQLFSVLFFLMMFTLGLGSSVAQLSAVTNLAIDHFKKAKPWLVSILLSIAAFLGSLIFVTPAGQWLLNFVDNFAVVYPIQALMCVETAAIAWLYGVDNISHDFSYMLKRKSTPYWRLTWGLITPVFLIVVLIYGAATNEKLKYADKFYPDHYYAVGWALLAVLVAICPLFIVYEIGDRWFNKKMPFFEAVRSAFQPSAEWGPSNKQLKLEWLNEREQLLKQQAAANESLPREIARKLCGCGTLPLLEDEEMPKAS